MQPKSYLIPVVLFFTVFFYTLIFQGTRGLWDPDEGRYTDIPLQMIHSGDYISPAFNDDEKHFAKPPLTYWAVAGSLKLAGLNEWAARLPNTLAIALTATLLLLIARIILPDRPWLPVLIYLTFLFPYLAANVVTTDTLLTCWETLAVLGFLLYWKNKRSDNNRKLSIILMWLGFSLAFMTKGPPGLLPLLAILIFVGFVDGRRALPALFYLPAMLVFVVVGLGWYISIAAIKPELLHYFFYDEFINRISTGAHHRNPQWYGAFVIYLPTLIIGTLPWTGVLFSALRKNGRQFFTSAWWKKKRAEQSINLFLVLWVLVPLVIFFLAKSRLPLYVLPLFPAIALLTAIYLHETGFVITGRKRYALITWLCLLIAVKWGLSVIPYENNSRPVARHIVEQVGHAPKEILFVDIKPVWGLSLYLDSEIERVSPPGYSASGKYESLDVELETENEPTLIIARADKKQQLIEWFTAEGYTNLKYWNYRDWLLIIPNTALDWQR